MESCTSDSCDPADGLCVFTPVPGCVPTCGNLPAECPAGFTCTGDGHCLGDDGVSLWVPGATFPMGCVSDPSFGNFFCDDGRWDNAMPNHDVTISAFTIDRTEVSQGDDVACVTAGSCPASPASPGWAVDSVLAAEGLSYGQAQDYCAWAGRRLCTEAEWEYAARGTDGRVFPWGDTPGMDCTIADVPNASSQSGCGTFLPTAVQSMPNGRSPFGAYHMIANVFEWVSDGYYMGTMGSRR